jgi:hypothetical protein
MKDFEDIPPAIKPRKDHREIKWLITFYVQGAPGVQANDGSIFTPSKVEVKNWPRRGTAYVTVTGQSNRFTYRSQDFNLRGAPKYPECPEWLKPLIKEAMGHAEQPA